MALNDTSFASWTQDDNRSASENWTKKLQYALTHDILFRGLASVDPNATGKNKGLTSVETFVPLPRTERGKIADDLTDTPTWEFDWTQVEWTSDEFGGQAGLTKRLQNLSFFQVTEIVEKTFMAQLKLDFEYAGMREMTATQIKVGADGGVFATAYDGTYTAGWDSEITFDNLLKVRTRMKTLRIPPYEGKYYGCILGETAFNNLMAEDDFKQMVMSAHETKGDAHPYMLGELGSHPVAGFKFFLCEDPDLFNEVNGVGSALFFGANPLKERVVQNEVLLVDRDMTEPLRRNKIWCYADIGWRLRQPKYGERDNGTAFGTFNELVGLAIALQWGAPA